MLQVRSVGLVVQCAGRYFKMCLKYCGYSVGNGFGDSSHFVLFSSTLTQGQIWPSSSFFRAPIPKSHDILCHEQSDSIFVDCSDETMALSFLSHQTSPAAIALSIYLIIVSIAFSIVFMLFGVSLVVVYFYLFFYVVLVVKLWAMMYIIFAVLVIGSWTFGVITLIPFQLF